MAQIPTTSTELLRNLAGDAEHPRWTEFVERYRSMMAAFVAVNYPDLDADDIIQDTLVALVKILPDYRYEPEDRGHFHNYLTGILRNKARAAIARRMRQKRREDVFVKDFVTISETEEDEFRHTVYEVALRQLLADSAIYERTKQIFIRTAIDGEKPEKVADAFGLSRNAVDQIKSRMMEKLRGIICALEAAGDTE